MVLFLLKFRFTKFHPNSIKDNQNKIVYKQEQELAIQIYLVEGDNDLMLSSKTMS